jgi:hypothetical protein
MKDNSKYYTAGDIRRRMNLGRIYVTEKVIEEINKRIVEAANNNFNGVQVSFDDEEFEKFNIDSDVMRNVRAHFEKLRFTVNLNKFLKRVLIQW